MSNGTQANAQTNPQSRGHCTWERRAKRRRTAFAWLLSSAAFLFIVFVAGCSGPPKMAAEDRRKDIEFLARWARDYSPLVELNERYKGTPSYEALLPRYVEFAEHARTDEEFYQAVLGYFNVIGASGHAYLMPDDYLRWCGPGSFLRVVNWGISWRQFGKARYWTKLADHLSTRAHPPFRVMGKEGRYFTDDDWQSDTAVVPKGSEIACVNGMTCSQYLDFIKANTSLRYDAYPKGWVDYFLLIVDEGPSFKGWQVDFRLPDGRMVGVFVPKVRGFPAPVERRPSTAEAKENCTCIELAENIGYIRIRSFMPHPLDSVFKGFIAEDRRKIASFLARAQGRYRKLIIDIRDNGGGLPEYYYENLIAPFLDEPVTWTETVGIRRKFLADTKPSVLRFLRKHVQSMRVRERETEPPQGFDRERWIFYEITREVRPSNRYEFAGKVYVLINEGCFSAADGYADATRRAGLHTLVGRNTSGMGGSGYLTAPAVRLPSSGMIFRLEVDLGLNPDGRFNEIIGTRPDIELPPADPPASVTREDLLKDEWIKRVIAEP